MNMELIQSILPIDIEVRGYVVAAIAISFAASYTIIEYLHQTTSNHLELLSA